MDSKRQRREAYALREAMFALKPPVVLVAEDDTDVRRLVATALRLEGCSVIEAHDGHDLAEQLGSALLFGDVRGEMVPITLVISDIHMNGPDGLDVLSQLRQSRIRVAVILMTADRDPALREEAARLGAHAFLPKPLRDRRSRGRRARAPPLTHTTALGRPSR